MLTPLDGRCLEVLPWLRVSTNEYVIRILSLTLATIAGSIAKATAVQQKSLGSLAKVVLYHRNALDDLLAEQRGVSLDQLWYCRNSNIRNQ